MVNKYDDVEEKEPIRPIMPREEREVEERKDILVRHKTVQEIAEEEGIEISNIPKLILAPLIFLVIATGVLSFVALITGHSNNILHGVTAIVYAIFITILVVK